VREIAVVCNCVFCSVFWGCNCSVFCVIFIYFVSVAAAFYLLAPASLVVCCVFFFSSSRFFVSVLDDWLL
jgi:hypothetical protein